MGSLTTFIGWMLAIIIALFALRILYLIYTSDRIHLELLLCESTTDKPIASMARFQFLVFTFVIALSLFLVIVGNKDGPQFPPKIPSEILALLGISGASYAVGKGIQASSNKESGKKDT
jgi:uncharacterized BrkB/YihY/UPF0761 family membrane protein